MLIRIYVEVVPVDNADRMAIYQKTRKGLNELEKA